MKISDLNFDSAGTVTKKCITFARDGNTVVKPYKKLYSLVTITSNPEHGRLFLEVIQQTSYREYRVWEQLTDFCICIGSAPEYATLESLTKGLKEYQFLGVDGYLNFLKEKEKFGDYINLLEIEVCRLLGQDGLAVHYAEYRENFLRERETTEKQRKGQKENKGSRRKMREKQQKGRKS